MWAHLSSYLPALIAGTNNVKIVASAKRSAWNKDAAPGAADNANQQLGTPRAPEEHMTIRCTASMIRHQWRSRAHTTAN